MSTITREFTKEQLQQIEAAAKEVLWPVVWSEKKARKHFSEKITPEVVLELARIALASLEAEPVGCDACGGNGSVDIDHGEMGIEHIECPKCYTAPPAPSVDDDLLHMAASAIDDLLSNKDRSGAGVWADIPAKLRRAAMHRGAEPVTTAYKLPDTWVACSERMPDIGTEIFYFCQDDGLRDCGIVSSSNFSDKGDAQLYVHGEGYDLRFGVDITHWMPLPAAPQHG